MLVRSVDEVCKCCKFISAANGMMSLYYSVWSSVSRFRSGECDAVRKLRDMVRLRLMLFPESMPLSNFLALIFREVV